MKKRRVYAARVKDPTGAVNHGRPFTVHTNSNTSGEWSTRAPAADALARAKANNHHLVGNVSTYLVDAPLRWQDWLLGDVVHPSSVPVELRDDYMDTLARATRAAARYGHPVHVNDSFRTHADQERRYATYLAGGPVAAAPGTSDHERGLSLDIPNARSNKALIRQLRREQMIDDVASEGWHVTNMARKRR